jgi:hypothetical protein
VRGQPIGSCENLWGFVGTLVIDRKDTEFVADIEKLEIKVALEDIVIPDLSARTKLAKKVLEIISTRML